MLQAHSPSVENTRPIPTLKSFPSLVPPLVGQQKRVSTLKSEHDAVSEMPSELFPPWNKIRRHSTADIPDHPMAPELMVSWMNPVQHGLQSYLMSSSSDANPGMVRKRQGEMETDMDTPKRRGSIVEESKVVADSMPYSSNGMDKETAERLLHDAARAAELARHKNAEAYKRGKKPAYSYASLIAQAILADPQRRRTLHSIYTWIIENYPYFDQQGAGWQNSIRHNLSLNQCFVKVPRPDSEPGKGAFWTIDAAHLCCFENGALKKRRARLMGHHGATPSLSRRGSMTESMRFRREQQNADKDSSDELQSNPPDYLMHQYEQYEMMNRAAADHMDKENDLMQDALLNGLNPAQLTTAPSLIQRYGGNNNNNFLGVSARQSGRRHSIAAPGMMQQRPDYHASTYQRSPTSITRTRVPTSSESKMIDTKKPAHDAILQRALLALEESRQRHWSNASLSPTGGKSGTVPSRMLLNDLTCPELFDMAWPSTQQQAAFGRKEESDNSSQPSMEEDKAFPNLPPPLVGMTAGRHSEMESFLGEQKSSSPTNHQFDLQPLPEWSTQHMQNPVYVTHPLSDNQSLMFGAHEAAFMGNEMADLDAVSHGIDGLAFDGAFKSHHAENNWSLPHSTDDLRSSDSSLMRSLNTDLWLC